MGCRGQAGGGESLPFALHFIRFALVRRGPRCLEFLTGAHTRRCRLSQKKYMCNPAVFTESSTVPLGRLTVPDVIWGAREAAESSCCIWQFFTSPESSGAMPKKCGMFYGCLRCSPQPFLSRAGTGQRPKATATAASSSFGGGDASSTLQLLTFHRPSLESGKVTGERQTRRDQCT